MRVAGIPLGVGQALNGFLDPAKVKLLLHFDADFTDSSPDNVAVTATGNVSVSTNSPLLGAGSAFFGDSPRTGALGTPLFFDFGNQRPFTICFRSGAGNGISPSGAWVSTSDFSTISPIQLSTTYLYLGNSTLSAYSGPYNPVPASSSHVAMIGDGTNIKLYENGVLKLTVAHPNWPSNLYKLQIGKSAGINNFQGFLDEFLLYDGVLWVGDFTPPSIPFVA